MQVDFFQTLELFSQASKSSLQALSHVARRHFYKKGTIILDRYESQQIFLYVIQGWIKLFKESAEGEEIIVDVLTQHNQCGETFLFKSHNKDAYMAQSISDVEIFTLPITLLQRLIAADHNLSSSFLQATLQKQKQLNVQIEHLSIQNAMQRIGCFLLRLCEKKQTQKAIRLQLPYDKVLLASQLGMRPETFSRALKKLGKQCKIQVEGEYIDIPYLQKLACYVCQHCSKKFPCQLK